MSGAQKGEKGGGVGHGQNDSGRLNNGWGAYRVRRTDWEGGGRGKSFKPEV